VIEGGLQRVARRGLPERGKVSSVTSRFVRPSVAGCAIKRSSKTIWPGRSPEFDREVKRLRGGVGGLASLAGVGAGVELTEKRALMRSVFRS